MTKTHVHVPSGMHAYRFVVESRACEVENLPTGVYPPNNTYGKFGDVAIIFFVIEENKLFELGPWFNNIITATEMAQKATRGDQFCNAIPCCPYQAAIPRADNSWFRPQEYSGPGAKPNVA